MTPRSAFRLSVIVCAHNEARLLPACLHSLLAQTRLPDEIVVVNNASTDETRAVAQQIPYVSVVDEPRKGLVVARETGRRTATGDILVYLDADLDRVSRRGHQPRPPPVAIGRDEPFLLCDFHVHTRWSDGKLTVREVVDLYGQTGTFDHRDHRPYPDEEGSAGAGRAARAEGIRDARRAGRRRDPARNSPSGRAQHRLRRCAATSTSPSRASATDQPACNGKVNSFAVCDLDASDRI